MKKLIYAIKIFLGIIAVWQIVGIIPVLTWVPRLNEVTADMLVALFIKLIVMFICGVLYYWIGRQQQKTPNYRSEKKELRSIGIVILGFIIFSVVISVIFPIFGDSQQKKKSRETQSGSEKQFFEPVASEAPSEIDFFLLMAPPHASEVAGYNKILQAHPDALEISRSGSFRLWALNTPKTWNAIKNRETDGVIAVLSEF